MDASVLLTTVYGLPVQGVVEVSATFTNDAVIATAHGVAKLGATCEVGGRGMYGDVSSTASKDRLDVA